MKLSNVLFAAIILFGCGSNKSNDKIVDTDPVLSTVNGDTLIVNGEAAVFYEQDSLKLEAEKQKNEADFTAGIEAYHMYLDSTQRFLDSVKSKTPTLNAKGNKFIKFVKSDNTATVIKIDSLQTYWGLYLFTPSKSPEEADMTDIRTSYTKYYK